MKAHKCRVSCRMARLCKHSHRRTHNHTHLVNQNISIELGDAILLAEIIREPKVLGEEPQFVGVVHPKQRHHALFHLCTYYTHVSPPAGDIVCPAKPPLTWRDVVALLFGHAYSLRLRLRRCNFLRRRVLLLPLHGWQLPRGCGAAHAVEHEPIRSVEQLRHLAWRGARATRCDRHARQRRAHALHGREVDGLGSRWAGLITANPATAWRRLRAHWRADWPGARSAFRVPLEEQWQRQHRGRVSGVAVHHNLGHSGAMHLRAASH